jgi:hypothetical protein
MAKHDVADTILEQLGGHPFVVMVGAKQFVTSANSLAFGFGRNRSKSGRVDIRLDRASDTYEVLFYHLHRRTGRLVIDESFEMVYADGLRQLFESYTGLATHL